MEVKKARRADLEKGKSRWLFMGLIVTLSFMFCFLKSYPLLKLIPSIAGSL